ncbi:MAG: peptide chain release factor-like protein [Proteobacteria bacterium]|nr:peptide chain release factor-like protein [Pseudomonadota bacterium]MBU1387608.1 peptide chain release factor-like protein [Pseudomonadota bacterium]MBU1544199.1 peptide chain release factor-like protein [Pseudomonadota bacterium]MBU2430006.1 peptide chain release factor-like protein [Pseudomonadota bacterium]
MGPDKKKIQDLERRMEALGILKEDIEEKFIKASGRGGQKINKTSCAVFVRHTKTQLSVKCATSRSQHLNRFLALRSLVEKIEALSSGELSPEQAADVMIRKQKMRRKRKTKDRLSKMLPVDRV